MTTKPIVLLVGITGMLGHKITEAILAKDVMAVRAIVRPGGTSDPSKQAKLDELKAKGVSFVEGDLLNPATLPNACEGVEAIVSAVSGDEELVPS